MGDLVGAIVMLAVALALCVWGFCMEFVLRPEPIRYPEPEPEESEPIVGFDLWL